LARAIEALLKKKKEAGSVYVKREGTRVVVLRGLSPKLAKRVATAWLGKVGKAVAVPPPFGEVALRAPPPSVGERLELRGEVKGERYRSSYLGVGATIPAGWTATTDDDRSELAIRQGNAWGWFLFDDRVVATGAEQVHRGIIEGLAEGLESKERPEWIAEGPIKLSLGAGTEWKWRFPSAGMKVRTTLVSACRGLGTWLLLEVWHEDKQATSLSQWRKSFQATDPLSSPACLELQRLERE
jgi:hypothetical protein